MEKHNQKIVINDTTILPGEHKIVMLSMPKLYDWTPLSMPIHVFCGKRPGNTLCVTGAMHGDEINGIEIIRRVLKKSILKRISGTFIAIPIVNVYGFLNQDRYLMDRRDLNRAFPGSKKGSLAARLAYLITKEILSHATHIIDLHTGSQHRSNLPQIRANMDSPDVCHLAKSFNAPVMLHAALRDGSMRQYANEKSIPFLLYEGGEALRFNETCIKMGVRGIINVLRALDMLPGKKQDENKISSAVARSSYWVRSPYSGMLRPFKNLGDKVSEGELLATIGNPTTTEEHNLFSPLSGIVIGISKLPMVHEGAALFHVACFEQLKLAQEKIEYLQESNVDNTEF